MRSTGGDSKRYDFGYINGPAKADTYEAGDIVQLEVGSARWYKTNAAAQGCLFVPYKQVVAADGDNLDLMAMGTVFCQFKAACEIGVPISASDGVAGEAMAWAGVNQEEVCGITIENVTDATNYFEVLIYAG
jgi:hypothetical protein